MKAEQTSQDHRNAAGLLGTAEFFSLDGHAADHLSVQSAIGAESRLEGGQEPTGLLPLGQAPGQHNKVESHRDAGCRENLLKEANPEAEVDTVLPSFPLAVGTGHPSIPHMPRQQGSKQDGSPTLHLTIPHTA